MPPRQFESGHLVIHTLRPGLGEGIVTTDADEWEDGLARVDFGKSGTWAVPLDELVAVWQPPLAKHPRGRREWLASKRLAAREKRRAEKAAQRAHQEKQKRIAARQQAKAEAAAVAAAAAAKSAEDDKAQVEKTSAELKAAEKADRKKAATAAAAKAEAEAAAAAEAEAQAEWDDVTRARQKLQQARVKLRGLEEGEPKAAAQALQAAEAAVEECEVALAREVEEAEAAQRAMDGNQDEDPEANKPQPKTLPEIAFHVLKEKEMDLLDGFRAFDTDGDGVLTPEELQIGLCTLTGIKLKSTQVQELMTELEGPGGDGEYGCI